METLNERIGIKISKFRMASGLTQKDLAQLMSVSRPFIANMEKGRQNINAKQIFVLCSIFGITPSDLFPPIKKALIKNTNHHGSNTLSRS